MPYLRHFLLLIALVTSLAGGANGLRAADTAKLKCGFIYTGPAGDYGWVYAHEEARKAVEKELPWMESVVLDSATEDQLDSYIDRLVAEGVKVIFTVSTGYMDGTLAAAERYPDVIFANCDGFKRAPNVATYMDEYYQLFYLSGLMSGGLTKSDKIGVLGSFPEPEAKRMFNAFALGAREVNPKATTLVRWINEWFNPPAVKEAAEALVSEGADVFQGGDDSPTLVQVAAKHGFPGFSETTPMYQFAPNNVVSGQLLHFAPIYKDFLTKVHDGTYTPKNLKNVDYWWLLNDKGGGLEEAAKPGMPINPVYVDRLKAKVIDHPEFGKISVYDLVMRRLAQMSQTPAAFDPFQGPVKDRKGVVRVPAGPRPAPNALGTMEWAAPGIDATWPKEP